MPRGQALFVVVVVHVVHEAHRSQALVAEYVLPPRPAVRVLVFHPALVTLYEIDWRLSPDKRLARRHERPQVIGRQRVTGVVGDARADLPGVRLVDPGHEVAVPKDIVAGSHGRNADDGVVQGKVWVMLRHEEELRVAGRGAGKRRQGVVAFSGVEQGAQHDVRNRGL